MLINTDEWTKIISLVIHLVEKTELLGAGVNYPSRESG